MSEELKMPTKYQPQEVEAGRYEEWLKKDLFKPSEDQTKEPYSIVIPPPNVTGKLHLGHAWDTTLQDIIIRQKRMQGYDTLWLPGMDHAGIATQAKVEEKLAQEGISRYDLGREKFIETVWDWKEEYASVIRAQWAKVGISVDYSRERFTLDSGLSDAVRKVFVSMYEKDLIYRGEYIINWDPKAKTALSDIEVIHKDVEGAFYHMSYPLADGSGTVELATTRPETMLGDTAIAVHPEDSRYKHLIGKMVILPLVNKEIPIIADDYVEMDFGTGVVKITPAHDPNDFEVGNRHDLPRINVMDESGVMNELAGKYQNMDRFTARKAVVADLKELGHLIKIETMVHSVGHSERTGVVVEPRLSTQWFVKMAPLAKEAMDNQATDQAIEFVPERFETNYMRWMENIHDWVISRQLWWGHQIPAWYHKTTGELYVGMEAPVDSENWVQDPDVLDTWFSSALWPFSTMGWPDTEAPDFKRYFPTNTLVTGYDIIAFWVSRMIFQSLEFTGKRPFQKALIHGLIRDEDGRKMSKSLGNGIDPMEVIDKYGADALRWFLSNGSAPGQDVRFSYDKMDAAWNFINKIWNASRFAIMNMNGLSYEEIDFSGEKTIADRWILTRLNQTVEKVTDLFEKFEFGEAGRHLYNFIWDDFCDWYIEMSKGVLNGENEAAKQTTRSILAYVLDQTLRLLHPIMPFVTEKIWESVPHEGESLVIAEYPVVHPELNDEDAAKGMDVLMELIRSVRTIRSEVNTPLSKKIELLIKTNDASIETFLKENETYIERFCNPENLVISSQVEAPESAMSAVITGAEIYLPLAGLINIDEEIIRLEKEMAKWESEVKRVQGKLSNERFVSSAPEAVVQVEREKEKDYLEKREAVAERIASLKAQQ
ncbi:valine--tRNA ligase [Carnobacterium maltaromaticum]|uniref:valine--tRNA ligase n=1 Tax=Carnobacterium maltaromaticum TaxID=2751 RepID=UPI000704BFA3|nr:valine--tRNA ligase [Carnobacterium maltaromaticum]MDT1945015.1 valine--tRNA ligase [Carnobacterium maltaromaticum]MDT1998664.1 valine--tRNA ligase [Carnobacterium maltaromaticum]TFJ27935.1 valine--tRNA ligase [Carnobacterium maltaromaticum]TFJ31618.1 valine--tRNA ligase [Carnobacterium maltaromaticum]TFJ35912.1 valine--tRNA ligase [Carnobacterium maltaromaticum]